MTYRDTSLVSKCGHYLNDVEVVHKVWGLVISLQIVYGITIVCCSVGREVSSDANQWSTVRNQTQSNIMFCQLSRKDVNNEKRVGKGSVFFKKTLPCHAWVSNTKAGTRCKSMATLWTLLLKSYLETLQTHFLFTRLSDSFIDFELAVWSLAINGIN